MRHPQFTFLRENARTLERAGGLCNPERKAVLQTNIEGLNVSRNTSDTPTTAGPSRRDQAWLDARLERGKVERFSEVVRVTPGMAGALLKLNIGNRPIVRSQVAIHVDRLLRGDFILHHHGAAVAKTGVLNDGQHRLQAICEAGIPGTIQITFGADREEFSVIDQGARRNAGQMLAIRGRTFSSARASIAGQLLAVRETNPFGIDPQLIAEYAIEIEGPELEAALHVGERLKKITTITSGAVAYYWIATRSPNKAKIAEFFAALDTGEGLTNPKLKLREWLRGGGAVTEGGHRGTAVKNAAVIVLAWNAWIDKRRTFNTSWPHVVKLPDPK